jgi:plastocyanin
MYDESLVVGKAGGLANAVVTLSSSAGAPASTLPIVEFDQNGCQYVPRVAAFPAGSTVEIRNSDGILHNIHTDSTINPVIDVAQPGFKKTIRVTITKPEVIKVTCDAHNWMQGWWYVTANPYYAVTDPHGHYLIKDIPAGTYTLKVWQEKLGTQTHTVNVTAGASTVADFNL